MNLLEFVVVVWLLAIVLSWCASYGPEIYQEQKAVWQTSHPKQVEETDSELTVEMPIGSFDPETTVTLPKIEVNELQVVFVISKHSEPVTRRRHARI
jgi:hypothetical protein